MMSVETATRPDLKRDRDSFEELADLDEPCSVPANYLDAEEEETQQLAKTISEPPHKVYNTPSTTPADPVPSSNATTPAMKSSGPPPAKKSKLTFQEKEMEKINKEIKDREKAEEKARKEEEKQARAKEKAKKDAEKEAEKKRKEAEKAEKDAEKKRKEAEKAEKEADKKRKEAEREEKRRKVEDEKKRKEEKKEKESKSQTKLGNFFQMPGTSTQRAGSVDSRGRTSMSPAPSISSTSLANPTTGTPNKKPDYETLFPPFFMQSGVTLAPGNRFERDDPATKYVEQQLDSYISGSETLSEGSFDIVSLFNMSSSDLAARGKRCMPVRDIMEEFYSGNASRPIDLTTESQNSQIKRTRDYLQKIPLKFLSFREDVRPPYRGTYTSRPVNGIAKLARKPFRRDLPKTDYDYDSEAEWVEDEDGEDLRSGDEEEEIEDDEDMDGFLDDEGDETINSKRLVLQGDLEPISTGLCWEDRKKRNTTVKMLRYRMEVILNPTLKSIDPFSTSYWEPATSGMEPPRIPLNTMKSTSLNFNNSVPASTPDTKSVKSFFTTSSDSSSSKPSPLGLSITSATTKDGKLKKLLPEEDMEAFKAAVVGSDLSKVGLIEVLKKKFHGRSAAIIKSTLETYAKRGRAGEKEKDKRWIFIDPNGM